MWWFFKIYLCKKKFRSSSISPKIEVVGRNIKVNFHLLKIEVIFHFPKNWGCLPFLKTLDKKKTFWENSNMKTTNKKRLFIIGTSGVRALPLGVAWEQSVIIFLLFLSSFLSVPHTFFPRRDCPRVTKFCTEFKWQKKMRFVVNILLGPIVAPGGGIYYLFLLVFVRSARVGLSWAQPNCNRMN